MTPNPTPEHVEAANSLVAEITKDERTDEWRNVHSVLNPIIAKLLAAYTAAKDREIAQMREQSKFTDEMYQKQCVQAYQQRQRAVQAEAALKSVDEKIALAEANGAFKFMKAECAYFPAEWKKVILHLLRKADENRLAALGALKAQTNGS